MSEVVWDLRWAAANDAARAIRLLWLTFSWWDEDWMAYDWWTSR